MKQRFYRKGPYKGELVLNQHKRRPMIDRFEEKIFYSPDGCWLWTSPTTSGYGQLQENGKSIRAHRFSYQFFKGEIPKDMHVLHRCDVPSCVNPDHLFLGTNLDNIHDKVNKQRTSKGSDHWKSKLNDELVLMIRSSDKSTRALARLYGLAPSTVRYARRGSTWKHLK